MRTFLIYPGVEKAFVVMPKNPEAIKVMVNKYKHTEMKLWCGTIPQAKSKGNYHQWNFLLCMQIIGKGLISLIPKKFLVMNKWKTKSLLEKWAKDLNSHTNWQGCLKTVILKYLLKYLMEEGAIGNSQPTYHISRNLSSGNLAYWGTCYGVWKDIETGVIQCSTAYDSNILETTQMPINRRWVK